MDFKYEVTVDGQLTLLLRELCPSDFYWFSLVENDFPELSTSALSLLVLQLLLNADEDLLEKIPARMVRPLIWWMSENLVSGKVMKVDQWLETAFHLCKQRWDSSVDWMETQPISKILLMCTIQGKFAEQQNREMSRSGRRC